MYWPCGVPQIFVHQLRASTGDFHSEGNAPEAHDTDASPDSETVLDISSTRSDHLFASITASGLNIWSARPTIVLATFSRSQSSLVQFGKNVSVLFRPDGGVVAIRTEKDFILTLAIEADPNHRVLQQHHGYSQARRQSMLKHFGVDDAMGLSELYLHFRRVIKIDAGIHHVIATEQELVVATVKPAAIQCIRWETPRDGPQAVAQLLGKLDWIGKTNVNFMTYDRAMDLYIWISSDGSAYAVQRARPKVQRNTSSEDGPETPKPGAQSPRLYDGFCFHVASKGKACLAAVNARFSLLALALDNGNIFCYTAKDYVGNVPFSHSFQPESSTVVTGAIRSLAWSADGYCLFVGYEKGWTTWSVFGRDGASTFHANPDHAQSNGDDWLMCAQTATWLGRGAEILITSGTLEIFKLDLARSAAVGCFSCANLVRALIQTPTELQVYKGHELPDLTAISSEASLWHHAQYPAAYLNNQWPIRSSVISQDGRYAAIAGRRGLAHYSINSCRWKTFADPAIEASFAVRGGMCWFGHVLAVATENASGNDLRLYSRELDLGRSPLYTEIFDMPIVFIGPSGEDSILVYTYENILYHYVISMDGHKAQLIQVGQIAFHGVVRAPSRVRSVSWVVPESQLRNGDPARDVEFASVLFLVDDKLVLLQPSRTQDDDLKYDLRIVANHVEYYILMRDQLYFNFNGPAGSAPQTPSPGAALNSRHYQPFSLRDSLWTFTGEQLRVWPSVNDVLAHQSAPSGNEASTTPLQTQLNIPIDFYPLSILLTKGVVLGIETSLLQRRDTTFAIFRADIRTQLFLPYVLRHQLLTENDHSGAFAAANQYQHLSYFPHALEILLHHVLDDEHERKRRIARSAERASGSASPQVELGKLAGLALSPITPTQPNYSLSKPDPLSATLSFLQLSLPPAIYLSTLVQCIRKTEVTIWPTLFDHLPPPMQLFEDALALEDLKTASGVLIILQGLEDEAEAEGEGLRMEDGEERQVHSDTSDNVAATSAEDRAGLHFQLVRLMSLAFQKEDYDLCAELARFTMDIDPSGTTLRRVIREVPKLDGGTITDVPVASRPAELTSKKRSAVGLGLNIRSASRAEWEGNAKNTKSSIAGGDYFSASPGAY